MPAQYVKPYRKRQKNDAAAICEAVTRPSMRISSARSAHSRICRASAMHCEQMRAAFGDNWMKHRVPGEIYKAWQEKRQMVVDAGERAWPLIAYADFTDYVPIIIRKDNWEAVFKAVVWRQTFVQESFQRHYSIRICTMHARLITQDDELYLHVETKRILSIIL